ncbi:hypothetical protein XNC1_1352 [Xenorhabdus nematophila ATCC 19061]|uniref:Uncharacterized protein n=1 Tax=Xenorhabdus nematophila (strain ATCC 19061 / DSM 3370 / CCUG 14189 / LMG 1036 / NCIMB 9965 / AN6) TaxID=406817 RepID=D3VAI0_XENNA|nr:hypothetical protein XNC1_1352 [Xenorhabdus nematophila ATCC 19061]
MFLVTILSFNVLFQLGYRQAVRHQVLILAYPGSNPGTPAIKLKQIIKTARELNSYPKNNKVAVTTFSWGIAKR